MRSAPVDLEIAREDPCRQRDARVVTAESDLVERDPGENHGGEQQGRRDQLGEARAAAGGAGFRSPCDSCDTLSARPGDGAARACVSGHCGHRQWLSAPCGGAHRAGCRACGAGKRDQAGRSEAQQRQKDDRLTCAGSTFHQIDVFRPRSTRLRK